MPLRKPSRSIVLSILIFLAGTFTGFLTTKWSYFSFEKDLNLVDVANLVVTALAGYYIASTLSKQLTAARIEKDLIISEIHKIRGFLEPLNTSVLRNQISFSDTVSTIKLISTSLTELGKLAQSCNYNIDREIGSTSNLNINIKAALTNDPNTTSNPTTYSITSRSVVTFNNNYHKLRHELLELIITVNRL